MSAVKKLQQETQTNEAITANLRGLIKEKGITEAELSRHTDIPPATLHKIFSGKTTDPRISTLKTLADYFMVTLDQLYSPALLSQAKAPAIPNKSVPIVSWKDCAGSNHLVNTLKPENWKDWAAIDGSLDSQGVYALITRPSMEPRFPRGTTLIVDMKIQPTDGDLIIVHYSNTDEATLRELSIDGPNKYLIPPNPNSPADTLNDSIKILATVTQSRFSHQ